MQRLAAQSASSAVQRQLRLGNADLAGANLGKEGEIAELRNQIAIIRHLLVPRCFVGRALSFLPPQSLPSQISEVRRILEACCLAKGM